MGAAALAVALALGANDVAAQLCDREGYLRHDVDCPNEARDATGCCPPPPPPAPVVRPPCATEGQVRSAATRGECCWPGQRTNSWLDCVGTPTRCPLGWVASGETCEPLHESLRSWNYPEVLGSTRGFRRQPLDAAFHELGQARSHVADDPERAAGHYEAAVQILTRARHPRAHVFRYHAAAAWERAGHRERAVAQLAAYLGAGGEDPPSFGVVSAASMAVRLEVWRAGRLWPTIALVWDALERRGAHAATPEAFDALATAARATSRHAYAQAAGSYDALQARLGTGGGTLAELSLRAAEAWGRANRQDLAAERYAVYLALGGEDPPPGGVASIPPRVRATSRSLDARWRSRFDEGVAAAEAGRHEEAREAFLASFASAEGHPDQAFGLLALGQAHRTVGDRLVALTAFDRAGARASAGTTTRRRAEAASLALRGTLAVSSQGKACALGTTGEVVCLDGVERFGPGRAGGHALRLSGGSAHFCAVTEHRRVRCWGSNSRGQLGDGTTEDRAQPVEVRGLTEVIDVAAGGDHSCALQADGNVLCWGGGDRGQLGDGGRASRTAPSAPLLALSEAVRIVAGRAHTCALRASGTVACWGANDSGQSGRPPAVHDVAQPVVVPQLREIAALTAGERHTCALGSDGSAYCWGDNLFGQLGDGTWMNHSGPISVSVGTDSVEITAGALHTCARLRSGHVRCWGSSSMLDTSVQDSPAEPRGRPREVGGLEGVVEVSAAGHHTCSRHQDGQVRCWRVAPDGRALLVAEL